jgi:hypothetical protein
MFSTQRPLILSSFLIVVLAASPRASSGDDGLPLRHTKSYKIAFKTLSAKLLVSLQKKDTHAIWLVDEGSTMRDDAMEIRDQISSIPKEFSLDSVTHKLTHTVASFGQSMHLQTKRPTRDIKQVQDAINRIPIDESGKENLFLSIGQLVSKFGPLAVRAKQQLVINVFTDESGTDLKLLEQCIAVCKRSNVQVNVFGRAAMFASGKARLRWIHPGNGLSYWIETNRGLACAGPETINYTGFQEVVNLPSLYGPFGQTRLVKETSGIFLTLPEYNQQPSAQILILNAYQPAWTAIREYQNDVAKQPLRTAVAQVATMFDANTQSRIRVGLEYSRDANSFAKQRAASLQRATYTIGLLDKAIVLLEQTKPHRAKETHPRWQANFDLTYAQCLAIRLRLIYTVAELLDHDPTSKPSREKSNIWQIRRVSKTSPLTADTEAKLAKALTWEIKSSSVNSALETDAKAAKAALGVVMKDHKDTPWATAAKNELTRGFGVQMIDFFKPPQPKIPVKPPVL